MQGLEAAKVSTLSLKIHTFLCLRRVVLYMPEGPLGGPRPGATPEGEIILHFDDFISNDELMSLRRAVKESKFPLIVVRQHKAYGDDSIAFKMDGEAITLSIMQKIKSVGQQVTDTPLDEVEVVFD